MFILYCVLAVLCSAMLIFSGVSKLQLKTVVGRRLAHRNRRPAAGE
ncbi:MAG: hypothetical protein M3541_15010 [Acidobacteriota bacterium]|nr:hypothetical protein [Acidobacteriota bacterium]MDQ3420059.1 hypothetical protein [Acidobacteriota bacterium]